MTYPFNVRVYGALVWNEKILLSKESYKNRSFTKLPGGGLEFGEGLKECLVREFAEELQLEITVGNHLYTTDFFQVSAFNSNEQVLSVYYRVFPAEKSLKQESIAACEPDKEAFWKELNALQADDFTFPIDKHMVSLLKSLS